MQIDYLVIEDMLYTTLIKSYVLEYSSPKVTVLKNPDKNCWDIHICFPFMGKIGISTDQSLPIADIDKKTLREVTVRLEQLARDIKEDCREQVEAENNKCPECEHEHNPDNENNFAKDINVPHKKNKQIEELQEQLARKTQECEKYEQALNEIEKVCIEDTRIFADGTEVRYDSLDKILDIINKAKGE